MSEKEGAVEILCKEINATFKPEYETVEVLIAFVGSLVGEIDDMIGLERHLEKVTGKETSDEAVKSLERVKNLLAVKGRRDELIKAAAKAHIVTYVPDEGDCDHYVDMLSSCVSAIRFGLEIPCRSRHAASAANHIWKRKYGIRLFDRHSNDWGKQWAKMKFNEAIGLTP